MDFSIMLFSAGQTGDEDGRYGLVRKLARFADEHGFRRVWLPERHFVPFGALHPSPSVLAAALAVETRRVRLAAGSVVMPLNDPLRVAEEWAIVDNLSDGRVDVSFASGWNPDDFALAPGAYPDRRARTIEGLRTVRRLWRGEPVERPAAEGRPALLRTYPSPVQAELPTWLTAARSVETFQLAGQVGANVLTYLVDLGVEALADNITEYRRARAQAGHDPGTGVVTVMLHAFVGRTQQHAHTIAGQHYRAYLRNNAGLLAGGATALGRTIELEHVSPAELDALVDHQFDRVFGRLSLMGTRGQAAGVACRLRDIGVDEIACLVDFVADPDELVAALPALNNVRASTRSLGAGPTAWSPAATIARLHTELNADDVRGLLAERGVRYGPAFARIERLWLGASEAVALLHAEPAEPPGTAPGYGIEAAALDNCLLTLGVIGLAAPHAATGRLLGLPREVAELELNPPGPVRWAYARIQGAERTHLYGDVRGYTEDGRLVVDAHGVRYDRVGAELAAPAELRAEIRERCWRPAGALPEHRPARRSGLAVCDDPQVAADLARLLPEWTVVALDSLTEEGCTDPARLHAALRGRLATPAVTPGVVAAVLVADVLPGDVQDRAIRATAAVVALARLAGGGTAHDPVPLRLLTRGAQVLPGDPVAQLPAAAAAWGAGRTIRQEASHLRVRLLDLDPARPVDTGLAAELLGTDGDTDPEVCLRGGQRWLPEAVPVDPGRTAFAADPTRSYLVTGADGGIGRTVSTWLAAAGARHLILLGRDPAGTAADDVLCRLGATVHRFAADVTDSPAVVAALRSAAAAGCPPVAGVVALAGRLADATHATVEATALAEALAPKCAGVLSVLDATADTLDATVVGFTSLAGTAGSAGQLAYAAANALADSLLAAYGAAGRPTTAVAWGPWADGGMPLGRHAAARLERAGIVPLADGAALSCLSALLGGCVPGQLLVVGLGATTAAEAPPEPLVPAAVLAGLATQAQRNLLAARLPAVLAPVIGVAPATIAPQARLSDLGLDSLMAFELRAAIAVQFGAEVPLGRLLDDLTVAELGEEVLAAVLLDATTGVVVQPDAVEVEL